MEYAKSTTDAAAIRDAIRKVTDPKGEKVYAGATSCRRASALIKMGTAVQLRRRHGPLQFDENGDIAGPTSPGASRTARSPRPG